MLFKDEFFTLCFPERRAHKCLSAKSLLLDSVLVAALDRSLVDVYMSSVKVMYVHMCARVPVWF